MTSAILKTFDAKSQRNEPVFVSFITAGFPTIPDTVPTMLALQQGGADIIELGIPFSDPQADGPAIQASNNVALAQNVDENITLTSILSLQSALNFLLLTRIPSFGTSRITFPVTPSNIGMTLFGYSA